MFCSSTTRGTELRGVAVATLLRDGVRVLLPPAAMALKPRTEPVPREKLLDEVAAVYLFARLASEDPVAACVEVFGRSRWRAGSHERGRRG